MERGGRIADLARMVHTARHLSPGQATAWVRRRLAGSDSGPLEPTVPVRRSAAWDAMAEASRRHEAIGGEARPESGPRAARLVDRRFSFVGIERHLPDIDWSSRYVSPLWTYHLHYFDFAVELALHWRRTGAGRSGEALVELWTSWLDAAEAGDAPLEPYPTSVRCMNALRCLWLVEDRLPGAFADRLLGSTHGQLGWLTGHLERHLRANHLQKNLAALAWGSLAFGDERAAGWSGHRDELWHELREQVLSDGGHFERSPMYHAEALDDFLRTLALSRAAGVEAPAHVPGRLAAMTRALQWLSRPDGALHLFNDAANGQGPHRQAVLASARDELAADFPEPDGDLALRESGYFGHVDLAAGRRLIIDAGPPGPAYQPGHAHCDMLSFELDLDGRPVVVDAGVHGYDGDPYREYVRSTRAHNTVSIGGGEQHEMWATFRVARRGEIVEARPEESPGGGRYAFRGACRPYHDPDAVHHRLVELLEDRLVVTDRVAGASGRSVQSWLHLHPDYAIEESEEAPDGRIVLSFAAGAPPRRLRVDVTGGDTVAVHRAECDPVQGWHCPEFGVAQSAVAIELRIESNDGRSFGWELRQT